MKAASEPQAKPSPARAGALLAASLAALLLAGCPEPEPDEPGLRVSAAGEVLEGALADAEGGVVAFKGVPYAAPPVGALRWRPPAAAVPRDGVLRARRYGPRCPQPGSSVRHARDLARDFGRDPALVPGLGPTSEDCLFLNIWTSNLGGAQPQPVMVWIHGGSNIWGGGDEVPYDGARLARRGVVVVTFNYRLGLLGFLAHPALTAESPNRSSGNYGLLDQIAALSWVQRNIAAFGGDPGRVTLAGASSGGADVVYLMTSPLSAGLFQRAVAQSGAPPGDLRTLAGQESRGVRLDELLEIRDVDAPLEELRAVPVERLLEVGEAQLNEEFDCAPVADGWALPDRTARVFAAGRQHDVPLLIGTNADEWTSIGRYRKELNELGLAGWLRSYWGRWAEQAARIYAASSPAQVAATVELWQTDRWFTCPARFIAQRMARVESPAYLYRFSRRLPAPGGARLGAYHGAELAYVFDNLAAESWVPRAAEDQALADAMAAYWVQFATAGDPNREGLAPWPPYGTDGQYLELGDTIAARTGLRDEACRLWERRLGSLLEIR